MRNSYSTTRTGVNHIESPIPSLHAESRTFFEEGAQTRYILSPEFLPKLFQLCYMRLLEYKRVITSPSPFSAHHSPKLALKISPRIKKSKGT